MKILQINKGYYPWIGGVETVVQQYAEQCDKDGEDVTVLCCNSGFCVNTTQETINKINIIRCASFGTFFSLPISISFFIEFFKIYKKFDIIHFHEPFPLGSIAALFLSSKQKIIITWHSDIVRQKILKIPFVYLQKKLCKKALFVTTTSKQLCESSDILSYFKEKIVILPLSINPNNYISEFSEIYFNLPQKYMLFFGRYSLYKGLSILLDAFNSSSLSNVKIVIAGHGELNSNERELINSNKNIIEISKKFSEKEKLFLIANCYAYIFPSISPNEAFGITQLEAMIYGKPVINTYLPTAVPWVSIHGLTGYTVQPKNIPELRNAVKKLWELPEKDYNFFSKNSKNRVITSFSDDAILGKLTNLYSSLK